MVYFIELRQSIFLRVFFPWYFVFAYQILQNRNNKFLRWQIYSYEGIFNNFVNSLYVKITRVL